MNENYTLAQATDPDFDKPHVYSKSAGDGSERGHCRCGRRRNDPIHDIEAAKAAAGDPEKKRDSLGDPSQAAAKCDSLLSPPLDLPIIADINQTIKMDKGSLILEIKFKSKLENVEDLSQLARLIKQGGLVATIRSSQTLLKLEPGDPQAAGDPEGKDDGETETADSSGQS